MADLDDATLAYREQNNVSPHLLANNYSDDNGNPTGGGVSSHGLNIAWQDGPRGTVEGSDELKPRNGAFVEDVIYAAMQRLQFFQESKYKHNKNQEAIDHLQAAIEALVDRSNERKEAGTLGKHEV